MGQALRNVITHQDKIEAAYRDPLRHISAIIPYLSQRHEVAKKIIDTYPGNKEAQDHLFSMIEALNKDIATLLGIEIEEKL